MIVKDLVHLTSEEFNGIFDNVAFDAAHESLGVYPQSRTTYVDGKEVTTQRTEREQGWNDCVMAFCDRLVAFEQVLGKLPIQHKLGFAKMHAKGCIFFFFGKTNKNDEEERPIFSINCNDLFAPAADCEEFGISDIPLLIELYDEFGVAGTWAFANMKRDFKEEKLFKVSTANTRKYEEASKMLKDRFLKHEG